MNFSKSILVSLVLLSSLLNAEMLSVQVKHTFLRSKASFLGKSITKLSYGEQVQSKEIKNNWYQVEVLKNGSIGWVHSSALIDKMIVLKTSNRLSTTSVSQSEVLMAGKGVNKQVESEYRKQNNRLNFKLVDKIENTKAVSRSQLIRFAQNGKLSI